MSVVEGSPPKHEPVLVADVLRLLDPKPGDTVLDGTVGLGGHAAALLPLIRPGGHYVGLDLDEAMLNVARSRLEAVTDVRLDLVHANYAAFEEVLGRLGAAGVDHMLLDLGVNSAQLADVQRGFSFDRDGPLDMRYDRAQEKQALDLVNALSEKELSDIFYSNAQEAASRKIAKRICQVRHERRITTTMTLARAVESALADEGRAGKIHPATRVFQALRVAVNEEFDNLRVFLRRALEYLKPGGKLAVISFHSLEDGIVKKFVREAKAERRVEDLTSRPVIANQEERRRNPRSRSAKLRVARVLGEPG